MAAGAKRRDGRLDQPPATLRAGVDGAFGEMRPNRVQVGGVPQNDCASHEVKRARAMALRLQRVIADTTDAMEDDGAGPSRLWL